MRSLLRTLFLAAITAIVPLTALAQGTPGSSAQPVLPGLLITSGCPGGANYCFVPYSVTNPLPVSASVTASVGGFQPSASGARMTPVSVTTSDSTGTLPTGAVVVVSNVGATNPMYCNVNAVAATTSDQLIPPDSWFGFTIPTGVTALHCIATGGSTTANGVGGAGLPTGAGGGGGSGGGGGGAITIASGGVASGAYASGSIASGAIASGAVASGAVASGAVVDGAIVTIGTKTDAKNTATDTTSVSQISILKEISAQEQAPPSRAVTNAGTFAVQSTLQAGSAIVGKVGIDQTTDGTTNRVSSNTAQVNGVMILTGAGATGTGSQRETVAQDTTTVAGAAPLTTGIFVTGPSAAALATAANQSTANTSLSSIATNTGTTAGTAATPSASVPTNVLYVLSVDSNGTKSNFSSATPTLPSVSAMVSGNNSATTNTSTSLVGAVTSKSLYLTAYSCNNTSATNVTVTFQDGSGGTTLWGPIEVPAAGGNNLGTALPLFKTTSGNALYTALSGSASTVTCSAAGFSQ